MTYKTYTAKINNNYIYYMTTGYPSKISPYFIGQIQLDGLTIPYYPSTVCNGKR